MKKRQNKIIPLILYTFAFVWFFILFYFILFHFIFPDTTRPDLMYPIWAQIVNYHEHKAISSKFRCLFYKTGKANKVNASISKQNMEFPQ